MYRGAGADFHMRELAAADLVGAGNGAHACVSPTASLQRLWHALRLSLQESTAGATLYISTVALICVFGEPVFYWVWAYLFPQPFESLGLRLAISLMALPLVVHQRWPAPLKPWLPAYWHAAVFVTLPFHFFLMLLANGFTTPWMLSVLSGAVLLALLLPTGLAIGCFVIGAVVASFSASLWFDTITVALPPEMLVVYAFTVSTVGLVSHRMSQARAAQRRSISKVRQLAEQNAQILHKHNLLMGHFLNNSVLDRMRALESQVGLQDTLTQLMRRQTRYCATLQAEIRGLSQFEAPDDELAVAQLVSSCYDEVASTGQDLAVIKLLGESLFVYSDFDQPREEAVVNLFCLACIVVDSVTRANATQARALGLRDLNVGIGLHAGKVVYGNLSGATLLDPTVVGVNVNLTARLEELSQVGPVVERLGPSAIILSSEVLWMVRRSGFMLPDVRQLNLAQMGVSVRDFPEIELVYGLPQGSALALLPQVRERIRRARFDRSARRAAPAPVGAPCSYQGIAYTAEMIGSGHGLKWCISVRVANWPEQQVWDALRRMLQERPELPVVRGSLRSLAQACLPDLTASTDPQAVWLELRTQDPGAHEQSEAHAVAHAFIEQLRYVSTART